MPDFALIRSHFLEHFVFSFYFQKTSPLLLAVRNSFYINRHRDYFESGNERHVISEEMANCKFLLVDPVDGKKGYMVTSEHHEPTRQAQIRFGLSMWRLKLPSETKSVY